MLAHNPTLDFHFCLPHLGCGVVAEPKLANQNCNVSQFSKKQGAVVPLRRERERERRRVDLRARPRPHCPPPPLQRNVAHLGATFPRPLAREVVGLLDCLCPPHGGCSVPAGRRHREPSAARRRGQRGTGHGGAVCPSGFVLRPPQSGDGNDALVQFNATGGAGLGSDVRPETR